MMDSGRVLHASQNDVHVLRFIGDIRYPISPSIAGYLDGIFSGSPPAGFVIDLTETDSIDSTNLGLLVQLAKRMQTYSDQRITIVSSDAEINAVLFSMALDEIFDIVEHNRLEAGPGKKISHETTDRETLRHALIEAHDALMDLSEENRVLFKDVVANLKNNRSSN